MRVTISIDGQTPYSAELLRQTIAGVVVREPDGHEHTLSRSFIDDGSIVIDGMPPDYLEGTKEKLMSDKDGSGWGAWWIIGALVVVGSAAHWSGSSSGFAKGHKQGIADAPATAEAARVEAERWRIEQAATDAEPTDEEMLCEEISDLFYNYSMNQEINRVRPPDSYGN